MRLSTRLTAAAALALVPVAFGQHGPTGSYGNVLHPGVPSSGALRAPALVSGGVRIGGGGQPGAGRIGGGFGNGRPAGGRRTFGGGAVYIPYPVYGGYGLGYVNDGFYATDSYAGSGYAEAAPAPPTVIINQNFQTDSVRPQFRDYSDVQLPQPGVVAAPPAAAPTPAQGALADDQPTIFLIAMQDHTIRPVIAYWVQEDTLHYVSLEGVLDHVSLAQVDRDFSKQLNAERNVPFALPPAR
jgi:hypothetical protein